MARIFQKYVTSEGRTDIPPEGEDNKEILDGFTDGVTRDKSSAAAFKFEDYIGDEKKKADGGGLNVDSAISIYLVMHGIRNMIQSIKGMTI